ncbi:hypothetical protein Desca_1339 [Desulfotomaculum nigrificans CO-1-SRB]|uniref:TIGR04086 family membrane protein n=1 Tax=Desulfotomaculum nigrificans (strain DSM 14880 / VKM B-2319 / CO-1-SRB) TaxID=868595 RepID=F6B4T6_DESCC|nr:TIGR04086 family membrane protein [Desulfotomaculum nigrificans]AEF94198.1 hypothetical protein Desca_1339 [Desulfotomaculum nigrificans CO-1-SRB]
MSPIKQNTPGPPFFNYTAILRGTLVSLGFSLGLSILAGLAYYFTSISENSIPWVAATILFVSVSLGSGYAAKRARSKGLFNGIGVGVLTFILIWILTGLFLPGNILLVGALGKLALTVIAGGIGGMIGVSFAS